MNRTQLKKLMEKLEAGMKLPLIEVHVLIATGPALLNRDINGRIKTIIYGGIPRARISSQSKNRPIRVAEYTDNAAHSKQLPQKVAQKLKAAGKDGEYIDEALKLVCDKKKTGTDQVLAFCDHDVSEIARIIMENANDATELKDFSEDIIKKMEKNARERAIDNTTALMGRMSTETRLLSNVEAARHISHLYSIDRWYGDSDTFTAVDDLKPYAKEPDFIQFLDPKYSETGSGHIDYNDIAANVFYGYTSVSTRTLLENKLRNIDADDKDGIKTAVEESKEIVKNYIKDYLMIPPSAKQASNATAPAPLATFITAGTRVAPITADAYFERIVKAMGDKSVGDIGVERLKKFAESLTKGAFSVNTYQKMYWASDIYDDMVPSNAEGAETDDALNAIASMIGE